MIPFILPNSTTEKKKQRIINYQQEETIFSFQTPFKCSTLSKCTKDYELLRASRSPLYELGNNLPKLASGLYQKNKKGQANVPPSSSANVVRELRAKPGGGGGVGGACSLLCSHWSCFGVPGAGI